MTCEECNASDLYVCEWCNRWLCETCMNKHECEGKR